MTSEPASVWTPTSAAVPAPTLAEARHTHAPSPLGVTNDEWAFAAALRWTDY